MYIQFKSGYNNVEWISILQYQTMDNIHHEHAKLYAMIHAIENSKLLTEQQKVQQVALLKTSQAQGTDSSPKTVWGITNCMIGSAMIIYPVLFVKSGIIVSPLVMCIVATIQYLTCRLLVIHNRQDEPTYNESILRIGGVKVNKLNSIVNMLLFFFVCVAYFILITHNFFQVSSSIFASFILYNPPSASQIVFSKYSIQWASIITVFAVRPIIFKKQIDAMLALAKYSIYCVGAYALFILLNLIRHIHEGNIHFKQFRLFNTDFSSVAGAFALSFLVHPMAAPILKKNINLDNNSRDLFFGYFLGASICFYVGFMGALSCAPEVPSILADPSSYSTIFDCVASKASADDKIFYWLSKLVQCGILFQNFSVLPIMIFLTRNQFISLVGKPRLRQVMFDNFTWVFLIFSTIIALLAVDVSIILSLDGAVIGFFMGYGIPIYIHLKCLYYKFSPEENRRRKSLMESMISESILGEGQHQFQLESEAVQCNLHDPVSKTWSYSLYGLILFCGVALGIFKISSVIG